MSQQQFRDYVEFVRDINPRPVHLVLFDFDGTLSLLREGWTQVMLNVFLSALPKLLGEDEVARIEAATTDIAELTGAPTIQQMVRLADRVRERCGAPLDPLVYKRNFLHSLQEKIAPRKERLRHGQESVATFLVPGALDLLEGLLRRHVTVHLASGTDEKDVVEETQLLSLSPYFGDNINGARDGDSESSKRAVIRRLLEEGRHTGEHLLTFGDGFVEIQETRAVGGLAVGVASDEAVPGRLDAAKRDRLLNAGADVVIANYLDAEVLLDLLIE